VKRIWEGGTALVLTESLGLVAGALTTFSLIPQIIRVFKLKSAREISALFTTLMLLGFLCWLVYGIILDLTPLIIWNVIASLLIGTLLYMKLRYGR
jgi:MtN3 and saliva related transmembrane protein